MLILVNLFLDLSPNDLRMNPRVGRGVVFTPPNSSKDHLRESYFFFGNCKYPLTISFFTGPSIHPITVLMVRLKPDRTQRL